MTFRTFLKDVFKAIPLANWLRVVVLLAAYLAASQNWWAGLGVVLVILLTNTMQAGLIALDAKDVANRDATIRRLLALATTMHGLTRDQQKFIDTLVDDAKLYAPPAAAEKKRLM
jgi:hypothetical protein